MTKHAVMNFPAIHGAIVILFGFILTSCDAGSCRPDTNEGLAALPKHCWQVVVLQTDLQDLSGLETFESNAELSILENSSLTDVSAIPESFSSVSFARNMSLESINLGEIGGSIAVYSSNKVKSISYTVGLNEAPDSVEASLSAPSFEINGSTPVEKISIGCSEQCELRKLSITNMVDKPASVGLNGAEQPPEVAPDLSTLTLETAEDLIVEKLVIGNLEHLSSLEAFYSLRVASEVRLFQLPSLEEGEVQSFAEALTANEFSNKLLLCDGPTFEATCDVFSAI